MGRPHIARAVAKHPDTTYSVQDVFDDLIGRDCPAYVARDVTDFDTGVDLLTDSCRVVGLAHPFRYDNPEKAIELTSHLDAIEGPYPYGHYSDRDPMAPGSPVIRAVRDHDRLLTGGTDAHGRKLGTAGLTTSQFEPLTEALGL